MRIDNATQQLNIIKTQSNQVMNRDEIRISNKEIKLQKESITEKTISEKELIKNIEKANETLNLRYTSLEFSIHEETKEIMVKVIDRDTGELIREIPPEKVLDAVAKMWEIAGIIIDEKC